MRASHKDGPGGAVTPRGQAHRIGGPTVDETGIQLRRPLGPVNLPSREAVPLTISVSAGGDRDAVWKELATVDEAVFTAKLVGAGDKRRELSPPWRGN